jgi:7-carboxy-7-deazaguanine synthase
MTYSVKEVFFTLQGEGAHSGRPAVFCRFSGCNLWTGNEADRASSICRFCDTDFVGTNGSGGGKFTTAVKLAAHVAAHWPHHICVRARPYVVCTGGEPLLQLDDDLTDAFHEAGFEVAVETNGTLLPPRGVDWICVSPKAGAELRLRAGHELKLVFPQADGDPSDYESLDFGRFYLQPMDGPERDLNTALALKYCLAHPQWSLSLQTHKILAIP